MSKNLKLTFTPEAKEDLSEIFEYIHHSLSAPNAAQSLIDKLYQECKRLTVFPHSGIVPRDDILLKKGYRILVVENFLVFYLTDQSKIMIMRILYGRRKYDHLL